MKRIFSLLAAAALVTPAHAEADGATSLFDGKTLTGWSQKNGTATYVVKEGTIVGTTAKDSPNSFLCTDKEYGDFELTFEVKVDNKLNSGVQIRSQTIGGTPDGRVNGPQVEIEATEINGGGEAGFIYGEKCGGWLTPKQDKKAHKHFKDGEWNTFKIVAKGANIQVWINGNQVSDMTDEKTFKKYSKGFIGLQVHSLGKGDKGAGGPFNVAWKNITIKELK